MSPENAEKHHKFRNDILLRRRRNVISKERISSSTNREENAFLSHESNSTREFLIYLKVFPPRAI